MLVCDSTWSGTIDSWLVGPELRRQAWAAGRHVVAGILRIDEITKRGSTETECRAKDWRVLERR